jgi:hypothetical protein
MLFSFIVIKTAHENRLQARGQIKCFDPSHRALWDLMQMSLQQTRAALRLNPQ